MRESLGSQFRVAREMRGLSIEDAARALRMKPARVADLEQDIYTNFASIAYAKGFVLNYGKLLGVDTKPYLADFDCSHSLGLNDYQYLSAAAPTAHLRPLPREGESTGLPLGKLIGFVGVALLVILAAGFGFYYLRFQQLGYFSSSPERDTDSAPASEIEWQGPAQPAPSAPPSPEVRPVPNGPVAALPSDADLETLLETTIDRLAAEDRALLGSALSEPELIRPAADSETVIVIRPIKKTFVRVISGEPGADPLFQSVLEPGADPVELSGQRFLIESSEDQALEIYRDGQVVAQPSGRVVIE